MQGAEWCFTEILFVLVNGDKANADNKEVKGRHLSLGLCPERQGVVWKEVLHQKWDFGEDLKIILCSQALNLLLELCLKTWCVTSHLVYVTLLGF